MPWSVSNEGQVGGKVKIPSTPTTPFVQYTTEELDQLDQPHHPQMRDKGGEQYPTVPPLVYGITPQESLADTDRESRKRDSPSLNQTVIRAEEKQEKLVLGTEVTTPLTQFTQNILGTSVVMQNQK